MKTLTENDILQRVQDIAGELIDVTGNEALIKRSIQKVYYDNVSAEVLERKHKVITLENDNCCVPLPCDVYRVLRYFINGYVINLRANMRNEVIVPPLKKVGKKELQILYLSLSYEYDEFGEPIELIYPYEALDMISYGVLLQFIKTKSFTNPALIPFIDLYENEFAFGKGNFRNNYQRKTITQTEEFSHTMRNGHKYGHNR
jgi:hypothetical protein